MTVVAGWRSHPGYQSLPRIACILVLSGPRHHPFRAARRCRPGRLVGPCADGTDPSRTGWPRRSGDKPARQCARALAPDRPRLHLRRTDSPGRPRGVPSGGTRSPAALRVRGLAHRDHRRRGTADRRRPMAPRREPHETAENTGSGPGCRYGDAVGGRLHHQSRAKTPRASFPGPKQPQIRAPDPGIESGLKVSRSMVPRDDRLPGRRPGRRGRRGGNQ